MVGKKYREVMSREEQCKVPLEDDWGQSPIYDKEKMRKEYNEYCPKSKSKSKSNFVFCPQDIIEKRKVERGKEEVQRNNDYFKKVGKKSRKKKTKRKGRDCLVGKERKKKKTKKKGRRGKRKKTKKRSKRGRKKKTKRKRKRRKRKRSKKKKTKKKRKIIRI